MRSFSQNIDSPSSLDVLGQTSRDRDHDFYLSVLEQAAALFHVTPRRILTRERREPSAVECARWVAASVLHRSGLKVRRIERLLHLDRTAVHQCLKRVATSSELQLSASTIWEQVFLSGRHASR